MKRSVLCLAATAALAAGATTEARADDKGDITAVAQAWVKAFIAHDEKRVVALGAPANQAIIDDFGPHYWNGPNALDSWYRDFEAAAKATSLTNIRIALSPSPYTVVSGKRAWAPLPMDYRYSLRGVPYHETGTLTVAMEKVAAGWRILGWTWARSK